MTARAAMLPAALALFSTMKGGRSDSVSHCATIRATMSEPARRAAAEDGVFRKEAARVGAVTTTGFPLPDTTS